MDQNLGKKSGKQEKGDRAIITNSGIAGQLTSIFCHPHSPAIFTSDNTGEISVIIHGEFKGNWKAHDTNVVGIYFDLDENSTKSQREFNEISIFTCAFDGIMHLWVLSVLVSLSQFQRNSPFKGKFLRNILCC